VITDFASPSTKAVFDGLNTKSRRRVLPANLVAVAKRRLDSLNAARSLDDLKAPPGNKLEKLRGDLGGLYSIRINERYRLVFAFSGGNASAVRITDYH
jgi:toxin HigB-1